jgi:glycerate dehydrogenase
MKEGAILINMGRGGIVFEDDLAKALNEKKLKYAILDVMENEPLQEDSPLLSEELTERLLFTPHIAWASIEARETLMEGIVQNIKSFLDEKN